MELPTPNIPDIDRCIQKGLQDHTFSAASCVASRGEKIFHRAVYGCPVYPPPLRKIGFDTLFDLASLTKPLGAGLAAMFLAGKGHLDLSITLDKTLPEFRTRAEFKTITLDMLLEHCGGFPALAAYVAAHIFETCCG